MPMSDSVGEFPAGEFPGASETAHEAGEQQAAAGLSSRQHRLASLLTRLAATARSFLLYDPHNETIQRNDPMAHAEIELWKRELDQQLLSTRHVRPTDAQVKCVRPEDIVAQTVAN